MVLANLVQFLVFKGLLLCEEKEDQILSPVKWEVIFLLYTLVFKHGTYSLKILEHENPTESLFSVDKWLNYERQITQKFIKLFKVVYNAQVIKHAAQVARELMMISLAFIIFNRNSSRQKKIAKKAANQQDFLAYKPLCTQVLHYHCCS